MSGKLSVELKGVYKVTSKGKAYYYAWRGGPRLSGEAGSLEFIQSYAEAHRKIPQDSDIVAAFVAKYKASEEFGGKSFKWRAAKLNFLDFILDEFGDAPLEIFEDKAVRKEILKFKTKFSATPRKADQIVGELSAFLNWCRDKGELANNFAEGIKQTPKRDYSDVIWLPEEIDAVCGAIPIDSAHGVRMAALTGLARSDLVDLILADVKDDAIDTVRNKTGEPVMIPRYDALNDLLEKISQRRKDKKVQPLTVLSNRMGRPFTPDGLTSDFNAAKKVLGIEKRFHDLRGTAVTHFYSLGFQDDEVADLAGWSLSSVRKIKKKYVSRRVVNQARITRLNRTNGQ